MRAFASVGLEQVMVWHDEQGRYRALTTFKLEGEMTSLSGSSQGEVGRLLGEVNVN